MREFFDIRPHCFVLIALAGFLVASSALMALRVPPLFHTAVFCMALAGAGWATWRTAGARAVLSWGAFLALTALLADFLSDVSFDGLHYHFPASLELARGLNLFHAESETRWVNIYPSGAWRISAAIMGLYDFLTPSIILNIYLAAASGVILLRLFDGAPVRHQMPLYILVLSAAFSPIVIGQMASAMLDGAVCSMYVILVALLVIDSRNPTPITMAAACSAAIILFSLKTSGMVFVAAAFGIVFLAVLLLERRLSVRIALIGTVAVALSIAANYKPFVTNMVTNGSPAPDVQELITSQRPANIREAGQLLQVASAVFAKTGLNTCCEGDAQFKIPGVFSLQELREAKTGPRSGGFGPFFGLITVLAIGIFSYYSRKGMGKSEKMVAIAAIGTLPICIAFPEPWIARYIAVMAPFMLLLVACVLPHTPRPLLWAVLAASALNSGVFVANVASAQIAIHALDHQFRNSHPPDGFSIRHSPGNLFGYNLSVWHLMKKMGYSASEKACHNPAAFYHEVAICFDGRAAKKRARRTSSAAIPSHARIRAGFAASSCRWEWHAAT